MNILLVSQMNTNSPTGVTTYYLSLKDECIKMGHHVVIITPEETPGFISLLLKIFRRIALIVNTDFNRLYVSEFTYFISSYYAVRKVRKNKKWDVVNGQDPSSSCAAKFALKGKVPVVTTCHFNDNPVTERELMYKLSPKKIARVTKWFKYLFSKVDNYIFVSKYSHDKSAHLRKPQINMRVINNGIRFQQQLDLKSNSGDFIITNVGTLEDRKNQILLINAASHLKKKGLPFKIWLLGNGPKKLEWEKKVIEDQLIDQVVFLGHKKNVVEIIKESHLYVHASKNENSGLCILEAFSIGLPALALANGGIPEQFPASGIGLIKSDTDAEHLANQIAVYFDLEKRKQLQHEEHEYAYPRFTSENMTKQTIDFYNSITIQ